MTGANVNAIRTAVEALNAGDTHRYVSAFHPDCQRWVAGNPAPMTREETAQGLEAMRKAFDGFRLEAVTMFGSGQYVCAHWKMHGTHRSEFFGLAATGRSIIVENAEIYQFDEDHGGSGLIIASHSFGDPAELLRQLGIGP